MMIIFAQRLNSQQIILKAILRGYFAIQDQKRLYSGNTAMVYRIKMFLNDVEI